jgi:predicted amidohydrolase YtcJ
VTGLMIRDCKIPGLGLSSVYCEGGRVTKISPGRGGDAPIGAYVLEANGGTLLPGLVDTHCHPFEYGWLKRNLDLRGTTNLTAVRLRLAAGVQRAKPGEWVTGMGWDQEAFPDRRMPGKGDIDDLSRDNPVALSRVCGHIALLNSRAIEVLNFSGRKGDEYERDGSGDLTGIVKERVLPEVFGAIRGTPEQSAADLQSVEAEAARLGLTALHCIVSPDGFREELEALVRLGESGALSLRYLVYVPPEALGFVEERKLRQKLSAGAVRIGGVKIYADGSFGARTAALRQPYADDPTNSGMLRQSDSELADLVELVDSKGYQAIIHAIGDRAVEQAVDALARVTGGKNPRRHRIEHASLLPRDLRGKMVKHGVRATVQPLFVTSDTWAEERLGAERVRDAYPFRSMLDEGIIASGSSDSPVESLSPILGMWAAMTRGGSTPAESLGMEEALRLYTANAASNAWEGAGGRLEEGAPADLTLLDSDIGGMHPALFRKVGVLATIVGGSVVHSYGTG